MPLTQFIELSGYTENTIYNTGIGLNAINNSMSGYFKTLSDNNVMQYNLLSGYYDSTLGSVKTISGVGNPSSNIILPICIPFNIGALTYTNMPANLSFFNNSSAYVTSTNLAPFTGVKLSINKAGTALVTGFLQLKYLTGFSMTPTDYLNIDINATKLMLNIQNTIIDSGWQPLVAGARGNVCVALVGSGGNIVLDPIFGNINAFFM